MTISKEMENALREIQEMALANICREWTVGKDKIEEEVLAIKTLGGIYNYCETVLRRGRAK